jgi:hypothetical protein
MRRYLRRFLFTQLSAIAVFCSALLLGAVVVKGVVGPIATQARGWSTLNVVVVLGMVGLAFVAMALWGKVLVWLGVLTAEEARGYPYSKPWEQRGDA